MRLRSYSTSNNTFEPPHNIEILNLESSVLEREALLRMIPSQTSPRLIELSLRWVTGVSHGDMLAFLTQVAPTLQTLNLNRCRFASPADEKESYFIDRAMPLCISLTLVVVFDCGNIASAACLQLKPTRVKESQMEYDKAWSYDRIMEGLVDSKWDCLILTTDRNGPYTEAKRIAADGGIELFLGS
jgi:hypothetical protein